ncbi:cytochrome c-type biogenesis protein CcmE homolog, mitochondrial-like [Salvia miltiorrhiza]|uniref:cytochrome c-type biogenesis protein CcmE homolog, mitochondrial-like n=1 Tax=Salvia miltiorrhiza TaxID=226208 RepID=UPI0025ABDFF7|nr:cytochrome c-type biogenesis protein CcmE homolog, mitochondrial-like [Salvia miltiorrhiza]
MAPRFLLRHLLRHHSTAAPIPKPYLFNSHGSPTIFNHPQHPILRFLSTRPGRSTRSKKPDIGSRARQLQTRRLWTYALTISCIAGFVVIVLNQFQDQLVFYVTPTEALDKYTSDPMKSKFRLGGLVLENSVAQIPSSSEIQFVITDLITDILVKYEGSLPDLFREGHSAVVEGFVKPLDEETKKKEEALLKNTSKLGVTEKARTLECYFAATEVLAKHDEKYMPAEVANAIEKNKKFIEEQEKNGKEASIIANAGDAKA